MDGGLGELKKQSPPAIINATPSSPPGITNATSPSSPSIINNAFPSGTVLKKTPTPKQKAPAPKQEALTPAQERLKGSLETIGINKVIRKMNNEADYANKNPTPEASISRENALTFLLAVTTNAITVATDTAKVLIEETPKNVVKIFDKAINDVLAPAMETAPNSFGLNISKKPLTQRMRGGMTEDMTEGMTEDITEDMTGGMKFSKPSVKRFNKMLFNTAYIPGILTLFAFLFLLFYLLWTLIQWALNKILSFLGSNKQTLPSIKFNKKTTQTIYSIFFVITSWFLMLYLFIDYFRNVGPELDIIQILKQLIGASYILWPMAVLVIGSGISKAFYKISCNGNKPNVLSWAKIVESSALYVLGIAALITVILLFKPIKYIYEKIPELVQKRFLFITVMVAVSLKLMVIYILLRMITIMIEDIISNKIVFFISKFNKDVEAPPVDCNAVIEEKEAKQSEIAKILEEIYMYISGILVCLIALFILLIQCPHPYMASMSKINHTIGAVFLQLTGIATRFIVENKYGKKDCSQKNKGSGLFKTPSWFSSFGKTGQQYSAEKLEEASRADAKDAEIQANDRKLGQAQDAHRRDIATALATGRTQALAQENTKGAIAEYGRLVKESISRQEKAPAEYVVSKGNDRHSVVPEPIMDKIASMNDLIRSKGFASVEGKLNQALGATNSLARKYAKQTTPTIPTEPGDRDGPFSGLPNQVSGDTAKPVSLSNGDTTERTDSQKYQDRVY